MKKLLTSTVLAAALAVALAPAAFAEEMMDSQLHQAAAAKHAFARYSRKAPDASFRKFLEDNKHLVRELGIITPETELPAGTIYYLPLHVRNIES
jgi:GH35 family endo-1,4-beta-xylanase